MSDTPLTPEEIELTRVMIARPPRGYSPDEMRQLWLGTAVRLLATLDAATTDVDAYLDSIPVMTAEELRRRWPASVERLLREAAPDAAAPDLRSSAGWLVQRWDGNRTVQPDALRADIAVLRDALRNPQALSTLESSQPAPEAGLREAAREVVDATDALDEYEVNHSEWETAGRAPFAGRLSLAIEALRAALAAPAPDDAAPWRVHNHRPHEGRGTACREYHLNGRLVGGCLITAATKSTPAPDDAAHGTDDEHAAWYRLGWEAGFGKRAPDDAAHLAWLRDGDRLARALDLCGIGVIDGHPARNWTTAILAALEANP